MRCQSAIKRNSPTRPKGTDQFQSRNAKWKPDPLLGHSRLTAVTSDWQLSWAVVWVGKGQGAGAGPRGPEELHGDLGTGGSHELGWRLGGGGTVPGEQHLSPVGGCKLIPTKACCAVWTWASPCRTWNCSQSAKKASLDTGSRFRSLSAPGHPTESFSQGPWWRLKRSERGCPELEPPSYSCPGPSDPKGHAESPGAPGIPARHRPHRGLPVPQAPLPRCHGAPRL